MQKAFVYTSLGLRRCVFKCFFNAFINKEDFMKKIKNYFSAAELALWICSAAAIVISFVLFDRTNYLTLSASLIGVTSLIFNAKGNPLGPLLMVVFSIIYGIISYGFSYYGEMLTYLGMTMPMSAFSFITWIRHPFDGKKSEVQVNSISKKEQAFMWILTLTVTAIFYFVLKKWNTANIIPSTLSVATSFLPVYLTFRRSPYYALGYASNDIVLIVLWTLASLKDKSYISVTVCFAAFLVNDLYGFINWNRIKKRQKEYADSLHKSV